MLGKRSKEKGVGRRAQGRKKCEREEGKERKKKIMAVAKHENMKKDTEEKFTAEKKRGESNRGRRSRGKKKGRKEGGRS